MEMRGVAYQIFGENLFNQHKTHLGQISHANWVGHSRANNFAV